jgi:hypothetical protein
MTTTTLAIAVSAALLLAGCAARPGPAPMTQAQLDSFSAAYSASGEMTVGDAVALAPGGMVGMIDVRVASGIGAVEEVVLGVPPEDFHDWPVVGLCMYADAVPSIEVAAVPPSHAQAFADGPGLHLLCDGPPEPIEG